MTRMKRTEPGHAEAVAKWWQTMIAKYGSEEKLHEQMIRQGRKGGANGHNGGFSGRPDMARKAGKKGGRVSRRGYKFLGADGEVLMWRRLSTGKVETYTKKEWDKLCQLVHNRGE